MPLCLLLFTLRRLLMPRFQRCRFFIISLAFMIIFACFCHFHFVFDSPFHFRFFHYWFRHFSLPSLLSRRRRAAAATPPLSFIAAAMLTLSSLAAAKKKKKKKKVREQVRTRAAGSVNAYRKEVCKKAQARNRKRHAAARERRVCRNNVMLDAAAASASRAPQALREDVCAARAECDRAARRQGSRQRSAARQPAAQMPRVRVMSARRAAAGAATSLSFFLHLPDHDIFHIFAFSFHAFSACQITPLMPSLSYFRRHGLAFASAAIVCRRF